MNSLSSCSNPQVAVKVWPDWKKVLPEAAGHFVKDDGLLLSSSIAFAAAFSLLPLCLVLIAGLGLLARISPHLQANQAELVQIVSENATPWVGEQLEQLLKSVQTQAGVGGPVGLVGLLLSATGIFFQLTYAFSRVWCEPKEQRSTIRQQVVQAIADRWLALVVMGLLGVVVIALAIANVVLGAITAHFPEAFVSSLFSFAARFATMWIGNGLLLMAMYRVLPRCRVNWRDSAWGAVFASTVWLFGQQVLTYLLMFMTNSAYGVIGALMALLLWIYFASAIVLLGAEVTCELGRERKQALQAVPAPPA